MTNQVNTSLVCYEKDYKKLRNDVYLLMAISCLLISLGKRFDYLFNYFTSFVTPCSMLRL